MDLVDLIVEQRKAILDTCSKYDVDNVRIFGSCARDDYTENSDVDMLVHFKKKVMLLNIYRHWIHCNLI